jgi:sugar transferase (PEP-CTERM/EpsH1 system associated)
VNVLFLSHRLPYAPNRGDRIRAYHLIREISRWAAVDVVSLVHDSEEAAHVGDVAGVVRSVTGVAVSKMANLVRSAVALPTSRPLTHTMLHAPGMRDAVDRVAGVHRPDVIFSFCTGVAPASALPRVRSTPLVLDMVDVDSAKWAALADKSAWPLSWIYRRESRDLSRYEADISRRAVTTLVVNERERSTLASLAPDAHVEVIELGVDLDFLRPSGPPGGEPVVVFCGVLNYAPNIEGVLWLARSVWPIVRKAHPAARLEIVGSRPSREVLALNDAGSGVLVTGAVPDVRPYLWRAAIAVAPLHTSRGTQNKVLEAVAAGLPTVTTTGVRDGLPPEVLPACRISDSAEGFAAAISEWLALDPADRRRLANSADVESIGWSERLRPLQRILTHAANQQ